MLKKLLIWLGIEDTEPLSLGLDTVFRVPILLDEGTFELDTGVLLLLHEAIGVEEAVVVTVTVTGGGGGLDVVTVSTLVWVTGEVLEELRLKLLLEVEVLVI